MTAVLHEFVATHRDEILALAVRKMKTMSPQRSEVELASDFDLVVDEIVRALQEHAGLPTTSPLPGKSAAASSHGAQRQRIGYALEKIALADERLLFSALSNLLQNAMKFTKSGGHVVLRALPEEGHVLIEVEDECGGLPPGKAEELFEPYVQRSEDRRGLGLGLAITREAIHLHGGELFVRNTPGKGCVFAVRLPSSRT